MGNLPHPAPLHREGVRPIVKSIVVIMIPWYRLQ